jgi:hypothetical protein
MTIKTTLIAAAALLALTGNAFALCEGRSKQIGTNTVNVYGPVNYVSGQSSGKDGWDGHISRCEVNGHTFLLPAGCGAPQSLVGTTPGPIYSTKTGVVGTEDVPVYQDQYRKGVYLPRLGWVGTKWKPGTC